MTEDEPVRCARSVLEPGVCCVNGCHEAPAYGVTDPQGWRPRREHRWCAGHAETLPVDSRRPL